MAVIKNHLPEVMGRHRIKQAELAQAGGLRYATVNALYNGKTERIDFTTMAGVITALRGITGHSYTVGDVFEYQDDQS